MVTSNKTGKAAIYCRISDDKVGAGLGVERQRQDCEKLSKALGVRVVKVLTDNDVSAYSGRVRSGYQELMHLIESDRISTVIAWHNDRLHRSPKELEAYIDAVNSHGVETHFTQSGQFDLSTPTGRMIARQVGVFARYESEHRAERVSRSQRQMAERGVYRGGTPRIFGYEPDGMTERKAEGDALRWAYRAIMEGKTLVSIMREFEDRGLKSARGKSFSHVTLKNVLLRPRNYGASVYQGEVVGTGQWDAIVDEATWRTVHAILTDPARKKNHSNRGKYLLGGILRCGKCEAQGVHSFLRSATAKSRKGTYAKNYVCPHGSHNAIRLAPTDEFITQVVLGRLTRDGSEILDHTRTADKTESGKLTEQANTLRARLNDLVDMFAAGQIDRVQHARASDKIKAELADIQSELTASPGSKAMGDLLTAGDIRAAWDALGWKPKRDVVNALMTLTLMPVGRGLFRIEGVENYPTGVGVS